MQDTVLHGRYWTASELSEQGCTKDQKWSWCKGQLGVHPIYIHIYIHGVSVIDKSLLCLVNGSDDFSLYATLLLLISLLFLKMKNITPD
jgi:hypothetical protein